MRWKGFYPVWPGELVEIDTVSIFVDGLKRYLLTAIDLPTRFAFAYIYKSSSSANARDFLAKLKPESHDQAIAACMYSWKSHKQHQAQITEIKKYSKLFFGPVAREIEESDFDFHVCQNCGSTMDEAPVSSCVICHKPPPTYKKISRPA